MKAPPEFALLVAIVFLAANAAAGEIGPGPNGGKLLALEPGRAEVLIAGDGLLTVTFLDAAGRPEPAGGRSVAVFAQPDSGRQQVAMEAKDGSFVSSGPLPQPEGYLLVVQVRGGAGDKPVNHRIKYDTHMCGGCRLAEYACTCADH